MSFFDNYTTAPLTSVVRRTFYLFDHIKWRIHWVRRVCPTTKPHIVIKAST